MSQRYRAQIGELDVSEEAEEVRELLYGIVIEFPSGIDAKFLEEQYDIKYVKTGIGTPLMKDWLRQLELAGEFEVKEIGGSATVYIVHKDAIVHHPLSDPPEPERTDMSALKETLPEAVILKEEEKAENEEEIKHTNGTNGKTSTDDPNEMADVLTQSSDESFFYVRIESEKMEFEIFLQRMSEFYTEHHKDPIVIADGVEANKLYAILDASFNWCRVLVKDASEDSSIIPCFFVDYGEIRSTVRSSLKKLESSFSTENIMPFVKCFSLSPIPPKICSQLPHLSTSTHSNTSKIKKIENLQIKFKIKETDEKHQYSVISTLDSSGKVMTDGPFKALQAGIQSLSPKANQPPAPVPAANLNIVCRDPKEMPTKKEVVHILSATDPDNISIRLEAWYPAPDYLYAAMTRDSENSSPPPQEEIIEGKFFAAKFEDGWERVQVIRQSTTTPGGDYWIVYAVDIGYFHLIQREQLRHLTESVSSFNRILLAKCKLNGIKGNETGIWSREIQTAMQDILESASKSTVEFIPEGGWTQFDSFNAPKLPYACGKLTIDGKDFAEKLISMGLAEKAS